MGKEGENCLRQAQRLAIFCPDDLVPEATWLADNKLFPIDKRKSLMAGDDGQKIEGVYIYVMGDEEQIRDLFSNHLGWEPQIFKDDGDYYDA